MVEGCIALIVHDCDTNKSRPEMHMHTTLTLSLLLTRAADDLGSVAFPLPNLPDIPHVLPNTSDGSDHPHSKLLGQARPGRPRA